jgi:hypothetical protein
MGEQAAAAAPAITNEQPADSIWFIFLADPMAEIRAIAIRITAFSPG